MWVFFFFQQELQSIWQTDIKSRKLEEPSEMQTEHLADCLRLRLHVTSVRVLFYMIVKGRTRSSFAHTGVFFRFAWLCRSIVTAWASLYGAWLTCDDCCTCEGTVTLLLFGSSESHQSHTDPSIAPPTWINEQVSWILHSARLWCKAVAAWSA